MRYTAGKAEHRRVKIHPYTKDSQGLVYAVVYIQGNNLNESLLRRGLASVDRQQCRETFCARWLADEERARAQRKGIWNE